ncbi:hypothetical protein D3C83_192370 [compost metagenome]
MTHLGEVHINVEHVWLIAPVPNQPHKTAIHIMGQTQTLEVDDTPMNVSHLLSGGPYRGSS